MRLRPSQLRSILERAFNSYEIATLLGKGGMGEVYRARDTKLSTARHTDPDDDLYADGSPFDR